MRVPGAGPGLIIIEGQQFRFQLEGLWKSEMSPRPGLEVEVELDSDLQVIGVRPIAGAQDASLPEISLGPATPSRGRRVLGWVYHKILRGGQSGNPHGM